MTKILKNYRYYVLFVLMSIAILEYSQYLSKISRWLIGSTAYYHQK
jgi:hypothetical protein